MPETDLHWIKEPALYQQANGEQWWPAFVTPNHQMGYMFAKRSDGENFFVSMVIPSTSHPEYKPELQQRAVAEATERLNSFEKCPCRVGVPCDEHKLLAGAVREGGQLPQPWVNT